MLTTIWYSGSRTESLGVTCIAGDGCPPLIEYLDLAPNGTATRGPTWLQTAGVLGFPTVSPKNMETAYRLRSTVGDKPRAGSSTVWPPTLKWPETSWMGQTKVHGAHSDLTDYYSLTILRGPTARQPDPRVSPGKFRVVWPPSIPHM